MMERVLGYEAKKYPERKWYAVDSFAIGLGEGSLVFDAAKIRRRGEDIGAAYAWCCQRRWRLHTLFTVDDLGFLRRSGRANAVLSTAGSVLKIKLCFRCRMAGKLRQVGKVRGRKKALQELTTLALTGLTEPQTIYISHGDCHRGCLLCSKTDGKVRICKKDYYAAFGSRSQLVIPDRIPLEYFLCKIAFLLLKFHIHSCIIKKCDFL